MPLPCGGKQAKRDNTLHELLRSNANDRNAAIITINQLVSNELKYVEKLKDSVIGAD